MPLDLDELAGPKGGEKSRRLAKHWLDQITAVKDNPEYKRWVKRADTIQKRYRDERNRTDEEGQRRYNSLWSNVEIMLPALYGKTPLPVAERRFKDRDPVGRNAAQILERGLRNEIEINGFHQALQHAVRDYLLPGRGAVWVRYEPKIEESVSLPPETATDMRDSQGPIGDPNDERDEEFKSRQEITPKGKVRKRLNAPEPEQDSDENLEKLHSTGDRIVRESVPVDYVFWDDFFTFPVRARTWQEVTSVAKRVYMSRDQMKRRFGKQIGAAIPLNKDERGGRSQASHLMDEDKGQVFEIWSKEDGEVLWVSQGYDYLCDRKDDPLGLENFYPCPKPLYANPTNNTLFPVPDFIQYQDQAIQIDELTQRIAMLTKACKMAGLYNAAQKDIQRVFNESVENELIPVDDWSAFAEKGGIEGNWSLMPVKDIIGILNELMVVKQKQLEEMDRLTGINDIMRGTSDARETLGGVRLKSNNTGTRLTNRQDEVARLARDTVKIMADIMGKHFSPKSMIDVSGALYEEGLGPEDMPPLTALQNPQGMPSPGGPSAPPQVPGAQPHPTPPGAPPSPPPGGGNVIPFPHPGAAPNAPPGAPLPPPPDPGAYDPMGAQGDPMAKMAALQRIAKALALIKDECTRGFRVDIEVDSTIYADQSEEKDDRTQFVVSVTAFLEKAMMLGASMPEAIPLLGKLLAFGARGQKIGRDMELAIEEFTEQAQISAKQRAAAAAAQPNPEVLKAQAEVKKSEAQVQTEQIRAQSVKEKAQADTQSRMLQAHTEQQSAQAEMQSRAMDAQVKQHSAQLDMQVKQLEASIDQLNAEAEAKSTALQSQMEQTQAVADMKSQQMQAASEDRQAQAEIERQQMQSESDEAQAEADLESKQVDKEMQEIALEIEKIRVKIEKAKAKREAAKPMPSKTSGAKK